MVQETGENNGWILHNRSRFKPPLNWDQALECYMKGRVQKYFISFFFRNFNVKNFYGC